ncbi:hypothetical protein [Rhodanobacter sp. MP1X3]|uniref:hypothetical protein n=1 Tax=Rhodanobacter sp. MP1X3 TaxID=2723086 RepID=UPI00160AB2E8|nr:hypothetical protein [Rhodanobacter sp. MP1X3]MBB6244489.1 hypothetical protein [Rhodanobacter sp. MP1X3]
MIEVQGFLRETAPALRFRGVHGKPQSAVGNSAEMEPWQPESNFSLAAKRNACIEIVNVKSAGKRSADENADKRQLTAGWALHRN